MNELITTHDEWKDLLITDENVTVQGYTVRAAPQLTLEIGFYLKQTAQNIIEVGKRLIVMKSFVKHGQWQQWLNDNFQLSQNTAGRFMQVAERFSNSATSQNLNRSQMIEMLSLPDAEETEKFIAEKAAEGKAVADMTIKQLREEIAEYKKQFDAAQKNEHAKKPKIDSIQNRIYISLARRADLPFFIVIYNSDFKNFYIVSGNELARRKLSCKRRHMTEYEYVKFLYKLRDLNTIPKEVLESIGYAQTEQKQGNLFEVADL